MIKRTLILSLALVVLGLAVGSSFGGDLGATINQTKAGPQIYRMLPKSLAKQVGLQEGDVLVKVNGQKVTTPNDIRKALGDKKDLTLLINRKGKEVTLKGTVFWPKTAVGPTGTAGNAGIGGASPTVFYPTNYRLPIFVSDKDKKKK